MNPSSLTRTLGWLGGLFIAWLAWWGWQTAQWGVPLWKCGLALSALVGLYIFWDADHHLDLNRAAPDAPRYPSLGVANFLSLMRGLLLAWLASFLCTGWPPAGWPRWLPGLLFTIAILADFGDGFLARLTSHPSLLGEYLDLHLDSLGVLIAALLAVRLGQMPWWFALTGLARYLFLAGEALLRARGVRPRPLPPSASRRAFAGVIMGLLAALLYPVFRPPATVVVGAFVFVPFILGFVRDFLAVAGFRWAEEAPWMRLSFWQPVMLPLVRVITGLWAFWLGWGQALLSGTCPTPAYRALGTLGLLLAWGVLPRFTAAACLVLLAWPLAAVITLPSSIMLVAGATVALLWGGGNYCLWAPDDYLFLHRVGGARQVVAAGSVAPQTPKT